MLWGEPGRILDRVEDRVVLQHVRYTARMTDGRHALAEETSLALHCAVAERLRADPGVLQATRARVAGWLREGTVARPIAETWAAILEQPVDAIAAFLADPSQRARDLRQTSPFAGALDAQTRWDIWRRMRQAARP